MSREEEAKLSSVLASWAPTVKEPFVFDKDDDNGEAKDDGDDGNEEAKDDGVTKITRLSVLIFIIVDDGGRLG